MVEYIFINHDIAPTHTHNNNNNYIIFLSEHISIFLEEQIKLINTDYVLGASLIGMVHMGTTALSVMCSVCIHKRNVFVYYVSIES